MTKKYYVQVSLCDDYASRPLSQENYVVEFVVELVTGKYRHPWRDPRKQFEIIYMTKERANALAQSLASKLEIEARLKD